MKAADKLPDAGMLAAARSKNVRDRLALATRRDTPRELLFFLAADLAPTVRRMIAQNPSSPLEGDLILARDKEDAVRDGLVEKSAARIPGNDVDDPGALNSVLVEILDILARDPSEAVRRALAEAIADLRHAPNSAIRHLAEDANPDIAVQVLRQSPVLQEGDLLAVVRQAASDLHLSAVAGRPHLPASVADALVALERDASMRTLLMNPAAHLREATLDRILDRAPDHPSWHEPLASYPGLDRGAAERLAQILADSLKDALVLGEDNQTGLAGRTAALARERIGRTAEPEPERDTTGEAALRAHVETGEFEALAAGLASRAGLPEEAVCEILAAATPRGVVALAWAADLPMDFAMLLQSQVARILPAAMLMPAKNGGYPLNEAEMTDQLRFFGARPLTAL